MRRLSIGKQNFEELIVSDLVYVDKTKQIHNIVEQGNLYFLVRPHRFGKSLLVSLFSHLFQGKKSLFENLAIGKTNYEFESYPVLKFNFSEYGYKVKNLEAILIHEVEKYAQQYKVKIDGTSTNAIKQIKNRNYTAAYRNAIQKTFLVGINFSKEERNVDTWEWEVWEN